MSIARELGPVGFRISATGSAGLDWPRLDATWALAGEQDAFRAGWLSDHLSDVSLERGGTAFEASQQLPHWRTGYPASGSASPLLRTRSAIHQCWRSRPRARHRH